MSYNGGRRIYVDADGYEHMDIDHDEPTNRITNGDRIRSMTDEELADLIAMPSIITPPWCNEHRDCPYADQDPARCDLCALDWLKQEVTD